MQAKARAHTHKHTHACANLLLSDMHTITITFFLDMYITTRHILESSGTVRLYNSTESIKQCGGSEDEEGARREEGVKETQYQDHTLQRTREGRVQDARLVLASCTEHKSSTMIT